MGMRTQGVHLTRLESPAAWLFISKRAGTGCAMPRRFQCGHPQVELAADAISSLVAERGKHMARVRHKLPAEENGVCIPAVAVLAVLYILHCVLLYAARPCGVRYMARLAAAVATLRQSGVAPYPSRG